MCERFAKVPRSVRLALSPYELAVYAALADYANGNGECWPGLATLARETHMSERQVRYAIGKLEQLGVVEARQRGRNCTNSYRLTGTVRPSTDRHDVPPLIGTTCHPGSAPYAPRIGTTCQSGSAPGAGEEEPVGSRTTEEERKSQQQQHSERPASSTASPARPAAAVSCAAKDPEPRPPSKPEQTYSGDDSEPCPAEPAERAEVARKALLAAGVWANATDRLLARGAGLCLLSVELGREIAARRADSSPAKLARACVERPGDYGVFRLHAWDAGDAYAGWRPPSDSRVHAALKRTDFELQARITADRRQTQAAEDERQRLERRAQDRAAGEAAWRSLDPAEQAQIRLDLHARYGVTHDDFLGVEALRRHRRQLAHAG
jgi:hypothetical protein